MDYKLQEIFSRIAAKNNTSVKEVEKVFKTQFKSLKVAMEAGEKNNLDSFKNILIPYLGKFVVKPYRIKYLTIFDEERKKEKERRRKQYKNTPVCKCDENFNTIEEFKDVDEAHRITRISKDLIYSCLDNSDHNAKGYKFKIKTDGTDNTK